MKELSAQERIDIVRYRLENARNTLAEVDVLINNGFYNTAVNRMYYACYYAACALLIANNIQTKSHDGVRQMFSLHFVKTGIVPKEYGRFYSTLFEERTTGDYEDLFNHDLSSCEEIYPMVKQFVATLVEIGEEWLKNTNRTETTE